MTDPQKDNDAEAVRDLSQSTGGPPTMFGKYRMERVLGEDGMGDVWLATDTLLERRVVIRRLPDANPALLARRRRAVQAVVGIGNHPGICRIYDFGEIDGRFFLSFADVEGQTLQDILDLGVPISPLHAAEVTWRLADALDYAHRKGVVHRDLKPANVVLPPGGNPVVMDFGIGWWLDAERPDADDMLEKCDDMVGTPAYMAPEQIIGEVDDIGPGSDVYSLGVILYQLLTGRLPFLGSRSAVMAKALTADPEPPSFLRPGLDPRLEAICLQAMAKKPEQRHKSMAAMRAALTAYLQSSKERKQLAVTPAASLSHAKKVRACLAVSDVTRRTTSGANRHCAERNKADALIHRTTDIDFPVRAHLGKRNDLTIRLLPSDSPSPHAHEAALSLRVPEGAGPLRVAVSIAAENFDIEGPQRLTLDVPREGASPTLRFRLRGQRVGPGRIMIDFSQNGVPVGSVDLFPEVVTDRQPAALASFCFAALLSAEESDIRLAAAPMALGVAVTWIRSLFQRRRSERARAEGASVLALSTKSHQAPDVVLKVFVHRYGDQPGRLQFCVSSARDDLQDLPVLDGDLGTQELQAELPNWVADQLNLLADTATRAGHCAADVERVLRDIGHRLYEQILPKKVQELLWTLMERGVASVMVLSDEPHVPWELIRPFRRNGARWEEAPYLGEVFSLTHWLRGRPPARGWTAERVVAMVAGLPAEALRGPVPAAPEPDDEPLPSDSAEEEVAAVRRLIGLGAKIEVLPARHRHLYELLENGGFHVFHFASHGCFGGAAAPDASALRLEDGVFRAGELSPRMGAALLVCGPLVVLNACETGRLGFAPTGLGSWGARLVQLGCGAFVGTLWRITDRAALAFAGTFYQEAAQGASLGEAVDRARVAIRQRYPDDPSWLAYCCFGDPFARLSAKEEPN